MKKNHIIAAIALMGLAALSLALSRGSTGYSLPVNASNGEKIYFTSRNAAGELIPCHGGPPALLARTSCVHCHRADGRGNAAMRIPPVTWQALTEVSVRAAWFETVVSAHDEGHQRYNEETLKRAITEGLSPEGHAFSLQMPRWRPSQSDLKDLVLFIQSL